MQSFKGEFEIIIILPYLLNLLQILYKMNLKNFFSSKVCSAVIPVLLMTGLLNVSVLDSLFKSVKKN